VYTGPGGTPGDIARLLVEQGLEEARLWVFEDMAGEGENLRQLSAAQAAGLEFAALNLGLAEVPEPSRLLPGLSDEAMPSGLHTKWPVRACSLAGLRLHAGARLWDVGAGSGAVAIEASARLPRGSVWAVERHPDRVAAMRQNIRAAKAWQVRVVCGQAPQALAGLPQPDRIFLGGGLDQGLLPELCSSLAPGGRLVANVVLLSSLNRCLETFRELGWAAEVSQVQASVAKPLAGDLRLTAQNPVFILAADKPA
jgi:precorrin-6Y C5,15-methyltransferase (decarboxylating)